jgi:hypothetical protein
LQQVSISSIDNRAAGGKRLLSTGFLLAPHSWLDGIQAAQATAQAGLLYTAAGTAGECRLCCSQPSLAYQCEAAAALQSVSIFQRACCVEQKNDTAACVACTPAMALKCTHDTGLQSAARWPVLHLQPQL